ncbi:MAG: Abortive infection protein, partial [Pedosphaera sp.]|nr:Abortive infection protein [Pedosphaera sp.]
MFCRCWCLEAWSFPCILLAMEMDQGNIPPLMDDAGGAQPKAIPRWRWWLHLVVLALFPLAPGVLGLLKQDRSQPLLPKSVAGLFQVSAEEMLLFGAVFGIAWLCSRANRTQLLLQWRRGIFPVLLGFGYSIALRLIIMMLMVAVIVAWVLIAGLHGKGLDHLRPQTEQLVNAGALTKNPLYLVLCLTLISFVVAALREELWRAGMLAGIQELFPKQFATLRGRLIAVMMVALLFGLGHTPQGWGGVALTGLLGLGLGLIMVWHR